MNLHEYQAKQLFADYGLPVSKGVVVDDVDKVTAAVKKIGGRKWMVKAQVHAGGRGKAGGVKLADSVEDVRGFAEQWLGKNLITYQTDATGQPVNRILIEACTNISQELYLGAVVDRSSSRIVFMASMEGGVEIEKVAAERPEKILKTPIDPVMGPHSSQGRKLALGLGLEGDQIKQFIELFLGLAKLFQDLDLSLLEINPLVITTEGNLECLDGKIIIDSNALYRQPKIQKMFDPSQDDEREVLAAQWDLNYVALDGNIGCMVNGAGLAMGTMDIIKTHGGKPANFLDVGGGTTKEKVTEAFKIILSDENVVTVLVNIFGGIVRCDLIAEGVVGAVQEVGVQIPVVVRLEGNNSELGREVLEHSGFNIVVASSLSEAAELSVALAEDT